MDIGAGGADVAFLVIGELELKRKSENWLGRWRFLT